MIERNMELNRTENESFEDDGSDEAAVWRVLGQRRIALRPQLAKRSGR